MDVAIVTGASAGPGLSIARKLVQMGLRVYGLDADFTNCAWKHAEFHQVTCDLFRQEKVALAWKEITERDPQVSILVHAAHAKLDGPLEAAHPDDIRRALEARLMGPALLSRYALPRLIRIRGTVFFVNRRGDNAATSMIEGGIASLCRGLYQELRDSGVKVCQIALQPNHEGEAGDSLHTRIDPDAAAEAVESIMRLPANNSVTEIVLRPQGTREEPFKAASTPLLRWGPEEVRLPEPKDFPEEPEPIPTPPRQRPADAPPPGEDDDDEFEDEDDELDRLLEESRQRLKNQVERQRQQSDRGRHQHQGRQQGNRDSGSEQGHREGNREQGNREGHREQSHREHGQGDPSNQGQGDGDGGRKRKRRRGRRRGRGRDRDQDQNQGQPQEGRREGHREHAPREHSEQGHHPRPERQERHSQPEQGASEPKQEPSTPREIKQEAPVKTESAPAPKSDDGEKPVPKKKAAKKAVKKAAKKATKKAAKKAVKKVARKKAAGVDSPTVSDES